jgi:hypothetical protein
MLPGYLLRPPRYVRPCYTVKQEVESIIGSTFRVDDGLARSPDFVTTMVFFKALVRLKIQL